MASNLKLLKVKPIAKTKKEFGVLIDTGAEPQKVQDSSKRQEQIRVKSQGDESVKPGVVEKRPMKTTIVDRRNIAKINRDTFLKSLKQKTRPEPIDETSLYKESPIETIKQREDATDAKTVPVVESETQKPIKIKKLKIKIKKPEKPQPSDTTGLDDGRNGDFEEVEKVVIPEADEEVVIKGKPVKRPKKIKIKRKVMNIKGKLTVKEFNNKNLPKKRKKVLIKTSDYYLSNRQIFVDFINNLFSTYGETVSKEDEITCEKLDKSKDSDEFQLLNHQKLVRDYINMYTPYRGILLFHGLGTGKTCSSIAIAEGMKDDKQVIIMTPASLRRNYIEELKACGDPLMRRNSHWVFLVFSDEDLKAFNDVAGVNDARDTPNKIRQYSDILSLSTEFLVRQGGAWLVNASKASNYESLNKEQRSSLENQIDAMISNKYTFINYNGLRESSLKKLTKDDTINPFDDKVIVIDEVHNLVSRIVNKLKKKESVNMRLYHLLCSAENCRIVFLSGTPIINYPNELGILFNMLRGYIKTFTMTLDIKTRVKVSEETLRKMFISSRSLGTLVDFIEYKPSSKTLVFSRNPFGFVNSFNRSRDIKGVKVDEKGQVDDANLMILIEETLVKNKIKILKGSVKVELDKSIPDNLDTFKKYFINEATGTMDNQELFKRFVMGLVSYYRSANEELMPSYEPINDFIIEKLEMNDYQFNIYEDARKKEREMERNRAKKKRMGKNDLYEETVSTYRIFSRLFCNFVFPDSITRPMPSGDKDVNIDEDRIDARSTDEILGKEEGQFNPEDEAELLREDASLKIKDYDTRIKEAIEMLDSRKSELFNKENLGKYSPKFLKIVENIESVENQGSHLIYSQFRTLEGIGILKMVLEANGFAQFKITKNDVGNIVLDIPVNDIDKPKFVLYTGTEDVETKEIYRNVFNGNWKNIPSSLSQQLRELGDNNLMGDIVKIFMITSSGAEGISLKNCRYVHIVEPYWHPVRVTQVIGRIRRICSHAELPKEMQNITVFMYLMTLSEKQRSSDESLELRLRDVSRVDGKTALTTDEALFEISNMKQEINNQLERAMKEASIDCMVYVKQNSKEGLSCLSFGPVQDTSKLSRKKTIKDDEIDAVQVLNKTTIVMKAVEITLAGKKYAFVKREDANLTEERPELVGFVYDYQSFLDARENTNINPRMVGELVKDSEKDGYVFNAI